ncbi:MAG: 4a-hydroxytetrahydrobiopterin dehydratase [Candidatus Saccharibacteria bacterium]
MWPEANNVISKTYDFPDFKSALGFVDKVGALAEAANHHPDIQLGWGKVTISLTSHDKGQVTDKDINLAKEIDAL